MLLALSVIGLDAARLGLSGYKVFDERGGVIGRLDTSDWVLHDAEHLVSARHARIVHRNQAYFVEDTSGHGTFINDPERPVSREAATPLRDGDRLFIGSFELLVQLVDDLPMIVAGTPQSELTVLPELSVGPEDPALRAQRSEPALHRHTRAPAQNTEPLKASGAARNIALAESALLRATIQGLLDTLQAQANLRQAMGMPLSTGDPARLGPLHRRDRAEEVLQLLLQEPGASGSQAPGYIVAAFQEIVFHDSALQEALEGSVQAVLDEVDKSRAQPLQRVFDATFARLYAEHLERLRAT